MHARTTCRLTLEVGVRAKGPLLIGDGETKDQVDRRKDSVGAIADGPNRAPAAGKIFANSLPRYGGLHAESQARKLARSESAAAVEAKRAQSLFIPGSSLAGVSRSRAEAVFRLLFDGEARALATCDPFSSPCTATNHCLVCGFFGCSGLRSHLTVTDLFPDPDPKQRPRIELRDGIAIDRFTGGGVDGLKFDYQVAMGGTFLGRLEIHNPERWQLGLLSHLQSDIADELAYLGAGSARGLGRFELEFKSARVRYPGREVPANPIVSASGATSDGLWTIVALSAAQLADVFGPTAREAFPATPEDLSQLRPANTNGDSGDGP